MNPATQQKIVAFLKLSAAVVDALAKQAAAHSTDAKAAEALVGPAVDALVANKRIGEHERGEALNQLRSHKSALEVLRNLAGHRTDQELQAIGAPEKKAAEAPRRPGRLGGFEGNTEADRVYLERLGIS